MGDQILAVDGTPVKFSYELLNQVQVRHIQIIVNKEGLSLPISWKDADKVFVDNVDWTALSQIVDPSEPIRLLKKGAS